MGRELTPTLEALRTSSSSTNLLVNNEQWVSSVKKQHPNLFTPFAIAKHHPHTFFLGCSDARYNESCLGYGPGEVFTFKTIANVFSEKDMSAEAALEYAVNCLGVRQIVVCGHTDCGGINTCLLHQRDSLKDSCGYLYQYLKDIEDLRLETEEELSTTMNIMKKGKYLSYQNVRKQVDKILNLDLIKNAMKEREIKIHGLIYNIDTGLIDKVNLN